METTEQPIRVTPQELQAVFDRLEAEHLKRQFRDRLVKLGFLK